MRPCTSHGSKNVRLSVCPSVCPSDNSSKSEPIWMNLFLKDVGRSISGSKMIKIGQVIPEIWAKKWSKTGKNVQKIIGHANILRNMRDREFGPKAKL